MKRTFDSSKPSFSASRDESNLSSGRLSEKTFNKKRFWLVIAIIAVAEALAFFLVIQWKYLFPSREVSEIYTRYENVEGIDVSYIKDFQVNDIIAVDVTLLEATDSAGWKQLKEDFNIIEAEDLPPDERDIFNAIYGNSISMQRAIPGKYNQMPDTNLWNDDVIACERAGKRVTVFHTANITNSVYASRYLLDQMILTNKLNIKKNEETN